MDSITASEMARLAQRIVDASAAFVQLATALDNVIQAAVGLTPAQRSRLRADAAAVPERLLHRELHGLRAADLILQGIRQKTAETAIREIIGVEEVGREQLLGRVLRARH